MRLPKFLLTYPKTILVLVVLLVAVMAKQAPQFQIDASADTLISKNDTDYLFNENLIDRYELSDQLVLIFRPTNGIFTQSGLRTIKTIKEDLLAIDGVTGITSLLDVPLFQTDNHPNADQSQDIFIDSKGVDIKAAKAEFQSSALYADLLLSKDGRTTAMQITVDPAFLGDKVKHNFLNTIRQKAYAYQTKGNIYLGGLEVIADDMITFLKQDLRIFGGVVILCMVAVLWFIFHRIRWILLAIATCVSSAIVMVGTLSLFGWKVTVVSSNFISLQIILAMSLIIHLIAKFQELSTQYPNRSQGWLIRNTIKQKVTPSFFAGLTTIVGFASLVFSGIVPVITFGWMMIAGICVSFVITFLLFIAILSLLPKLNHTEEVTHRLTPVEALANITHRRPGLLLFLTGILIIVSIMGMLRLEVENSFINYFRKSTDLHRGLAFIDKHLGGTTPLDIIITLNDEASTETEPEQSDISSDDGFDDFDDFDEFDDTESDPTKYWLTTDKVDLVRSIHSYLDEFAVTGKILSIWSTVQIAQTINDGPLDNFELAVMGEVLPQDHRHFLMDQFISPKDNEMRISIRMLDSDPNLRRNDFIKQVEKDLVEKIGLKPNQFRLAGSMILYNNILQKLFQSQILTLAALLVAIGLALMVLLRSIQFALIAIIPNIVSVGVVLGGMGWLGLPLDIMTITIASITVGIAVDDAIHYIYRFRKEVSKTGDYVAAMHASHQSVGHAMMFTTLTISLGFGILVFSKFIPNIVFGLLTALAMCMALLASLTLMSVCLILFKPYVPIRRKHLKAKETQ